MEKGYQLTVNAWLEWKCKICGNRKPMEDNEEWLFCCDKAMAMVPMWKLGVEKSN